MTNKVRSLTGLLILAIGASIAPAQAAQAPGLGNVRQLEPGMHPVVISPTRSGELATTIRKAVTLYTGTPNNTPITYTYGLPVLTGPSYTTNPANIHLIWYGSWNDGKTATKPQAAANAPKPNDYFNFVNQFLADVKADGRWKMNNIYYYQASSTATKVQIADFAVVANTFVPRNDAKYGKTLGQTSIKNIASAVAGTSYDKNAVYLVLTSSDVAVSGFNAQRVQFCGWHSATTSSPTAMKYGFVGNSTNVTACQGQTGGSPNGDIGADSMISVLLHEIEEAITDPNVTGVAWRDSVGNENADKCAWTWGTISTDANGISSNMTGTQGGLQLKYLVQQGFALGTVKSSTSTTVTHNGACAQK